MKIRKPKYTGVLARPMVLRNRFPWGSAPKEISDEALEKERRDQLSERFIALYRFYDIDPNAKNAQIELIWRLAEDNIRGFQVVETPQKGRGRPKTWANLSNSMSAKLMADVFEVQKRKKVTASSACYILTHNSPYLSRYKGNEYGSLYRRFCEAQKQLWALMGKYPKLGRKAVKDELIRKHSVAAECRAAKAAHLAEVRKKQP